MTDKGYHSGDVLVSAQQSGGATLIAEPDRGRRKWAGKRAEQAAVYANRQRIGGHRGKQLLKRRGELVERRSRTLRDGCSAAIVRAWKTEVQK